MLMQKLVSCMWQLEMPSTLYLSGMLLPPLGLEVHLWVLKIQLESDLCLTSFWELPFLKQMFSGSLKHDHEQFAYT